MCSVPMKLWLSRRASSWANTSTLRARSVKRSNNAAILLSRSQQVGSAAPGTGGHHRALSPLRSSLCKSSIPFLPGSCYLQCTYSLRHLGSHPGGQFPDELDVRVDTTVRLNLGSLRNPRSY